VLSMSSMRLRCLCWFSTEPAVITPASASRVSVSLGGLYIFSARYVPLNTSDQTGEVSHSKGTVGLLEGECSSAVAPGVKSRNERLRLMPPNSAAGLWTWLAGWLADG
jgi:hypothetical protein